MCDLFDNMLERLQDPDLSEREYADIINTTKQIKCQLVEQNATDVAINDLLQGKKVADNNNVETFDLLFQTISKVDDNIQYMGAVAWMRRTNWQLTQKYLGDARYSKSYYEYNLLQFACGAANIRYA